MIKLRDYQENLIASAVNLVNSGEKGILLVAGCGTGKSIMAAMMASHLISLGKRVLFMCDLRSLPTQMLGECHTVGLTDVTMFCAGRPYDRSKPMILAMAQTLTSRLKRETPSQIFGDIDVVIFDEAHQSRFSKTADKLMAAYPNATDIGLTATPTRTNPKEYLGMYYSRVLQAPQTAEMIKRGAVLRERVFTPSITIDTELLTVRGNEYTEESQASQVNTRAAITAVVDGYEKCGEGLPFAAYCVNLEHTARLAAEFNARGIRTECQAGDTPMHEREAIKRRVELGITKGICSVGTMAVGFNLPEIGCVIWCRETMSKALFEQSIGRGCRILKTPRPYYPDGKNYYVILNYTKCVDRFGLPSDHKIFDIGPKPQKPPKSTKTCPDCGTSVNKFVDTCPECGHSFNRQKMISIPTPPEEIDVTLVELFSRTSKKHLNTLKAELIDCFEAGLHPGHAANKFKIAYSYRAPDSWYRHLMYGPNPSEANKVEFWTYLQTVKNISSDEVRDALYEREFGEPFTIDVASVAGSNFAELSNALSGAKSHSDVRMIEACYQAVLTNA